MDSNTRRRLDEGRAETDVARAAVHIAVGQLGSGSQCTGYDYFIPDVILDPGSQSIMESSGVNKNARAAAVLSLG
jgi:hypothetical protein